METLIANIDTPDILTGSILRLGPAQKLDISKSISVSWRQALLREDDESVLQGDITVIKNDDKIVSLALIMPIAGDDDQAIVYTILFNAHYLNQLPDQVNYHTFFPGKQTKEKFAISQEITSLLDKLDLAADSAELDIAIQRMQLASAILVAALRNISEPVNEAEVPACRFLAYDSEREKILEACAYIQKTEGKPYTIKELSRKVAMNECYLKKGFKALTGKTVHEYQQDLRINKAKEMLKTQGVTVTDVALTLGYSSISHFSTAFKRVTGLKPCELLS